MKIERIPAPVLGSARASGNEFAGLRSRPRLPVTVVFTTEAATVAALKAAADVSRHLDARILLGMPELVPPQYPLEKPLFPVELLERRAARLLCAAGIPEDAVTTQVWFCRDRNQCLRQVLGPHSLVVIGGRWHWWSRNDWKLEKWLSARGHRVIRADARATNCTEMPKSHGDGVVTCVVNTPKAATRE